jgi:hypothetical protein
MLRKEHPTEEDLMEFALHGGALDIGDHVLACPACAKAVREFKAVGEQVASLADEEVPECVEQRVLGLSGHRPVHGHAVKDPDRGRGPWLIFANPVFIALLVALLVIALYFLVGSEVLRAP